MQIRRIRATFGKLYNCDLSLAPGLNLIYAPNESGKSTWTYFLRTMLYGLNTRDRGMLADKNRFAPWDGSAMQGRMDLMDGETAYTVTRTTRRANSPMGEFHCTYGGTATDVPGVNSQNCGEFFLGVPREVFERSAFIGQNALAVGHSSELERRIASLMTTGQENTSYSESYDRLKKQLNRRKHNRTGQIPVLEAEIADLQRRLESLDSLTAEAEQTRQQVADTAARLQDLQSQEILWQQIDAQNRYRQSLRQRQDAEEKLGELRDRSITAKAVMETHPLHGVSEDNLQKKLHPAPPKKPLPNWVPLVGIALCLIASILLYIRKLPLWNALLCICVAIPFGILGAIVSTRNRAYRATLTQQAAAVAALQQQISEYRLLQQAFQNAAEALEQYRTLYDSLPQVPPVPLTELPVPPLSAKEIARQLPVEKENTIRLRSRLDTLTGRLQSLGSTDAMRAQLQQKQEQLSALQTEYDALALAMDALAQANTTLQNRFSPALGARAADIFHQLTAGRYDKVLLGRDFSLCAEAVDDPTMRNIQLLSRGAADQLYLAVRLAICQTVLPCEKCVPLILDDALVSFDDKRLHAALDYLLQESKQRQILLFTCQMRESTYLAGREDVTFLSL